MTQYRLDRLREQLRDACLDGLLVSSAPNRRYLSGFTGSAGTLLLTDERALLLSDFRYQSQAAAEAPAWEFQLMTNDAPLPTQLPALARELGIARLGFEAADLTVAAYEKLQRELTSANRDVELVPTEGQVERLRWRKDPDEIAILRRAIAITDAAFAALRPLLRPTMRERDLAWELEKAMREHGADGLAFDVIVAAGDNGSRPHARPGDAPLGQGRPIVLDFGARLAGYHADMTRTVVLGEPDEQFWTVYNTVLEAQQAAAAALQPGLSCQAADSVARDLISAAGYGSAFGHGLGHGVGLVIHEAPALRQGSSDTLEAGVVCSVEPGIYLPGWGGVRIEDLVLITDTGSETLTGSSKNPVIEIDT